MLLPIYLASLNIRLVYTLSPRQIILTNSELLSKSLNLKHQFDPRILISSACPCKGLPPTMWCHGLLMASYW
jgi:hypothetical protein